MLAISLRGNLAAPWLTLNNSPAMVSLKEKYSYANYTDDHLVGSMDCCRGHWLRNRHRCGCLGSVHFVRSSDGQREEDHRLCLAEQSIDVCSSNI